MHPLKQTQTPITDRQEDTARLAPGRSQDHHRSPTIIKKWWQQALSVYRQSLPPVLRMPAAWILAAACLAGCLILVFSGYGSVLFGNLPVWTIMLVLTLLALPLTAKTPSTSQESAAFHPDKTRWGVQVAVLLLVIAFISSVALIHFQIIQAQIPLLSPLANWLLGSLEKFGQTPTLSNLAIPLLYFVVPMALLLLLGVRFREVGFGRGYRSWAMILLFSFLPLVLIVLKLVSGEKGLLILLFLIIQNSLRNGFFEEFLFRGPLLSRLNLLFGKSWGVMLATLIFGLFHIPAYTASFRGDLLVGIGYSLVNPVVFGLCYAIIVLRTRTLFASSVIHALHDTLGQFVFG